LEDVALGKRVASRVAGELLADEARVVDRRRRGSPQEALAALAADHLTLNGSEGGVVSFAQCCMPIPGDKIMGYQSAERGIVVHQIDCANVPEFMRHPERCISMSWDEKVEGEYTTRIIVISDNRPGVLAQIASVIAQGESNIANVDYLERDARTATIRFVVEVKDTNHLADLIRRMRRLEAVHSAERE
jgi:guanosine-3',5'-bis(diphosphate) 3'-pyrophosphohydrolase